MGVTSADVDNDGDNDLLVVNLNNQSDSFFRNEGSYFFDATQATGLGLATMRHTRFGVTLADFDNDGVLDLYEANGKIASSAPTEGDEYAEPNMLFRGSIDKALRFDAVSPVGGVQPGLQHTSRALAVGDVDDDGGLDLVVTNRDAAPYLLVNRAKRGNWLRFKVRTGNRDALGATVSATVGTTRLSRDVQASGSYLAANDPRVHFGLASESEAKRVTVRWTDGGLEAFGDFKAGTTYVLQQGTGSAVSGAK